MRMYSMRARDSLRMGEIWAECKDTRAQTRRPLRSQVHERRREYLADPIEQNLVEEGSTLQVIPPLVKELFAGPLHHLEVQIEL